ISFFSRATGTFGKNLAKIARDVDQPGQWKIDKMKEKKQIRPKETYQKNCSTSREVEDPRGRYLKKSKLLAVMK
ncbi:hypothetical protein KI387_025416, partial [Taxus chinensis]